MGPSRRVLGCAIAIVMTTASGWHGPRPAAAQQYEPSLSSVEFLPDPLTRSPRLVSMGRLTLASDLHNGLNFWDLAGNPLGVAVAESLSSIEFRPVIRTAASSHDQATVGSPRERQDLGARQVQNGLEAWHRTPGGTSYGVIGQFATLKLDRPSSEFAEARSEFNVPALAGVVNGPLSWVSGNRLSYAIRLAYTLEVEDRGYFDFFSIPQGDYIGRRTDEVPAPDTFTPDHNEATTLTGGIGLSYKVTGTITAAAMVHHSRSVIKSRNIALRSESHVNEERPVDLGEFGLHGTLGKHIEWIADGQGWSSHSEEFFIWTVSAGATQAPLAGSGKMLDRDAEGTALRTRARWTSGTLQIDAGFNTSYSRTITTPWYPPAGALLAGFNDFLDQVGFRTNADSLALPARIVNGRIEARGYEYSGGFSWRSPWRHALIGAEFHSRRTRYAQPSYTGPVPKGWDVRGGAEVRLAPTVLGRLGYVVGYDDADDLSAANTFLRRTATFGLGFQPAGSRWSADLGYAFQWVDPDFGDPSRARGSQQELALQLRWPF